MILTKKAYAKLPVGKSLVGCLTALGVLAAMATPTQAAFVTLDSLDRIATISGLEIEGETYDATMYYNTTWSAFKAEPIDFTLFPSLSTYRGAGNAIVDAVRSQASIRNMRGTGRLYVPIRDLGTRAQVSEIAGSPSTRYSGYPSNGQRRTILVTRTRDRNSAFVAFSPAAVPEPSSLLCAGLAASGMGIRRKRRVTA